MLYFLLIRGTRSNIFVHIFRKKKEEDTKPSILIIKSLKKDLKLVGKSKTERKNQIEELVKRIVKFVKKNKPKKDSLILVFKNLGIRTKKQRQASYGVFKVRYLFKKFIKKSKLHIKAYIDASGVPFNGCQGPVLRRKKKKHRVKDTIL